MILDNGICTVFEMVDKAEPGFKPDLQPVKKCMSWFGFLDFATAAAWPTESREEIEITARIRIHRDRTITNKHVVVLEEAETIEEGMQRLEVVRAYHGHDDESGDPITDLSLKAVRA